MKDSLDRAEKVPNSACFECLNRSFPIHRSAVVGHVECMRRQFANLHNPDILLDGTNCTPLHAACSAGRTESVKYLLQYTRIPQQHENDSGETCCHLAALNGHWECLKILLGAGSFRKAQSLAVRKDARGCTVLHRAVASGDDRGALWLLRRFGKSLANLADNDSVLPLHIAAGQGNIDFVRTATKCDSNAVDRRDKNGASPVFYAVENGRLTCCKYLIEKAKGDVDVCTKRGQSLVHAACLNGHSDIVRWLFTKLDKACVCQQTRDSATPFHYAAYGGHATVLKFLYKISGGKKLLILLTDKIGNTPLHLAALKGHRNCVQYLLTLGADPEVRNKSGFTPLDVALKRKHAEVSQILRAAIEEGNRVPDPINLTAEEFILQNSHRLVRPHSMSTSGYSSTAATSEAYEIAADSPRRIQLTEASSGYSTSASRANETAKPKHRREKKTCKKKAVEYTDTVLSRENWLLKKRRELIYHNELFDTDNEDDLDPDTDTFNVVGDERLLIDRKVQTDFDPLLDDIVVVDDRERIIFESGNSTTAPPSGRHGNHNFDSTTTTDSSDSFEMSKRRRPRRPRDAGGREKAASGSVDKISSNSSDFLEQADSDLQESLDSSRFIGFNDVYDNESYDPEMAAVSRIDEILKGEIGAGDNNSDASATSSSGEGSGRTKSTVVAVVHQRSVERVVTLTQSGGGSSVIEKSGCAVLAQTTIVDRSKIDRQIEPSLSLPFVYEPGNSVSAISSDCAADAAHQKSISVDAGSPKSASLADLSGLGSERSRNRISADIDNIHQRRADHTESGKPLKYETPEWRAPPRRGKSNEDASLERLSPLLAEMRRCPSNNTPGVYCDESKSVRFECDSPTVDRSPINRVAEIRKLLEQQLVRSLSRKTTAGAVDGNVAEKSVDKSMNLNRSIDSTSYRYFGVSNASDSDLRRKTTGNVDHNDGSQTTAGADAEVERAMTSSASVDYCL